MFLAHAGLLQEFWEVFSDPAHILAEGAWEFLTGLLLFPAVQYTYKRILAKHDREVHGNG